MVNPAEEQFSSTHNGEGRQAASFTCPQNKQNTAQYIETIMARPRTPASQLNPDSLAHNKGRFAARSLEPKTLGGLGRPSKWLSPP